VSDLMIDADRLSISFGSVSALQNVSIAAPRGSVLGLLGHNGAGKTTLVNILATLLVPDSGTARVGGFDVVRQPREVRRRIGLTGQYAAVDEQLSGRDNLRLIAGLLGAGRKETRARADELLEAFDLSGAAVRRPAPTPAACAAASTSRRACSGSPASSSSTSRRQGSTRAAG